MSREPRVCLLQGRAAVRGPRDPLAGHAFVGREKELAELGAAVDQACAGRGKLVLLGGEPGIGKTLLAMKASAHARGRGMLVLWGRGWEAGGACAYWHWVQLVRGYARRTDPVRLAREMGAGAVHIARVVPEVRERLEDLPAAPVPLAPDASRARFKLFDAMATFWRNAAANRPLMLVLDDVHGADLPSLRLLQFLARGLVETPILVVGTYCEMEARRAPAAARVVGELARESESMLLGGLREPDVARLVELTAGIAPPRRLVARLERATGGNPFFVREVARVLAVDGQLERAALGGKAKVALPEGVRAMVRRRLAPFGADGKEALRVAAVVGEEFDLATVQQVTGLGTERLLAVFAEAVGDMILVAASNVPGRYAFAHALIRETLYDDLAASRRVGLHREVGKAIEALHGADLESHLPALAHHFVRAALCGEGERAVAYATRAGEEAVELLAYEDAVGHFEDALGALEMTMAGDRQRRCGLLLSLGAAHRKAGDAARAADAVWKAADLARELGAAESLASAALGFTPGVTFGVVDRRKVQLLEEALAGLPSGDSMLRARVLARLAWELYWSEDAGRRAALSKEAVEMARRSGDGAALAYALNARRFALWGPEDAGERLEVASEMLSLAERAGDRELEAEGHHWRILDLLELGDIAGVDREIAAQGRLAAELRQPVYLWWSGLWSAMRALLDGRFAEAERLIGEALALGERVQNENALAAAQCQVFILLWQQGRLENCLGGLEALRRQTSHPSVHCGLAWIYSELGRRAEARHEFELLAAEGFRGLPRYTDWLSGMAALSEACAFLGDSARAAVLYESLLPYDGRSVVTGPGIGCFGPVSRFLGLLAATRRAWDVAEAHFTDALDWSGRMGSPPIGARARHDLAAMLTERGGREDRKRALALLEECLGTAERLGMAGLAVRALGLRARVSLTAAGELRHGSPCPGAGAAGEEAPIGAAIFRRDGEYWTIAYEGRLCRLRDSKGLGCIAHLLRHPGEEVLALELAGAALAPRGETAAAPQGSAGPLLDGRAKEAYRGRLAELRGELEEAERLGDLGQAARARAEIEYLEGQLAAAVGLGGRDRPVGAATERARLAVTKRIRAAIRRIGDAHPSLGNHLATSIKTGNACAYAPPAGHPVSWVC